MHTPKTHKPKIRKSKIRKSKKRTPEIHFEQVPLETVRKIVKEQLEREICNPDEIDKKTLANAIAGADEPSPVEVSFGPIKL